MRVNIKVVPKSSRSRVGEWIGDTLKVCVAAPAERGKANAAVTRVLADALGVSRKAVRIVAGLTSSRKIVEVEGMEDSEIQRRLEAAPKGKKDRSAGTKRLRVALALVLGGGRR